MLRSIVTDLEALKIPCVTLEDVESELSLIREVYAWVKDPGNGALGLAAPQVGSKYRWFVMKNPSDHLVAPPVVVVVNPKMQLVGKQNFKIESCFSDPGARTLVTRWPRVSTRYMELNITDGQLRQKKVYFNGRSAQIFQHEFDHLRGKCISHNRDNTRRNQSGSAPAESDAGAAESNLQKPANPN